MTSRFLESAGRRKQYWAKVPLRALCDDHCTLAHIRTLGMIAWHARTSGCWAGLPKIAAETRLHPKTTAACQRDLVAWGYVIAVRDPDDARKVMLKVIFDDPVSDADPAENRESADSLSRRR